MAIPEKYSHIDFTPPKGVRKEAEYGLKLRREYGRGGTAVGIARARDLANGVRLSPSTLRRMKAFFDRHQSDEKADGFFRGDKNWPSNGLIANKLWGGPNGYAWARKVVEQMNAADEKEGRDLRPYGSTHGMKPNVYVVHGAPGSGKQDYVAKHKGESDVVFDFYKVMSALSGGGRNEKLVSYCLDIRNLILKKALSGSNDCKTWIITTNVSDEMRKQLSDIPTKYVHVESTKEECLRRIEGEPDAEELRQVIEEYFAEERRAAEPPGVERRFLGNFSHVEKADPELLRVERRADPSTGNPRTYVVGYAARFHKDSLLLGDFVERISPEAFEIVEKREDSEGQPLQTRCLFNHSPDHLLGRFPTTMRLIVDDKGLKYECLLPESRSDIAELIERGDLRGSSFSFVVADGGEKWTTENGRSIRLVTKIKSLLDCGPVTYPAYGDSTVAVAKRSYQHFVAEGVKKVESRSEIKERAAIVKKEMAEFLSERRSGDCGRDEGGRFGSGNKCQEDDGDTYSPSSGKDQDVFSKYGKQEPKVDLAGKYGKKEPTVDFEKMKSGGYEKAQPLSGKPAMKGSSLSGDEAYSAKKPLDANDPVAVKAFMEMVRQEQGQKKPMNPQAAKAQKSREKAAAYHDEMKPLKDALRKSGVSWPEFATKANEMKGQLGEGPKTRRGSYRKALEELKKGAEAFQAHLSRLGIKKRRSVDPVRVVAETTEFLKARRA